MLPIISPRQTTEVNSFTEYAECFQTLLLIIRESIVNLKTKQIAAMKRLLSLLILLFGCSVHLSAQVDAPYITDDFTGKSIEVKEKSVIYLPNPFQVLEINSAIDNKLYVNLIADLDTAKPIKIKKQTQLPLIGFIRNAKVFNYDMYIVEYNGKRCFVLPDDVLDNSLLKKKNRLMHEYYACLLDSLSNKKADYDSLAEFKKQEIESVLSRTLEEKTNLTDSLVDALYQTKLAEKLEPIQNTYKKWLEQLPLSSKKAAAHLTIQRSELYPPNSAGGCDYRLRFTNMSSKTIKYLYWYGNVYNAVNDKVPCTVRNTYSFSGKCTGPIKEHDIDDGGWDSIIYNWSAKEMRLTKITIVYMDGSSISISGSDIINICNAPECFLSESNMSSLYRSAESDVEKTFQNTESIWKDRKKYIDHIGSLGNSFAKAETKQYLNDLVHMHSDLQKLERKIKSFELQNNLSVQ